VKRQKSAAKKRKERKIWVLVKIKIPFVLFAIFAAILFWSQSDGGN
jgi:hypothetical protein